MQHIETKATKQIFISYSRIDREACIALRLALEQAGLSVFQDEDTIRAGDRWVTKLEQALKNCSAFVLLVGRGGIHRWVGAEVQIALNRHLSPHNDAERLPIFPILLDEENPESLPPFLALFQSDQWIAGNPLPDTLIEAIKTHAIRTDSRFTFDGCPFLGLSAFDKGDARLFFGRRKETLEALACLGDQQQTNPDTLNQSGGMAYNHWLQVEGNSGAGKSSLVKAGMLPMIEKGALWARTGFDRWTIIGPMMPGKNPLANLAETLEQGLVSNPAERNSLRRLKCFEEDPRALAFAIKDFKDANSKTAFLLIIDQFEELFTFADDESRKQFDALLAYALQDPECPLFLINTIRADFLDRFELLPSLQTIYNNHCKRYFLPIISEQGLHEVIEQPARLAGLNVSEVTTAILADAKDEIGALPLVENALLTLWQNRQNNCLSGEYYHQQNGIAGMLSTQADALLQRFDQTAFPKGRQAALELLLRLTRISDDGRHTRQRITREEAILVAGNGNDQLGEHVLLMLSGGRSKDAAATEHNTMLRLITLNTEQGKQYVDLIHETLIRARTKDKITGELIGYWPTLYNYIEKNRDRDLHRQQLKFISAQWQQSKGLGCLTQLTYFGLGKYRVLRIPVNTPESRFLTWSQRTQHVLMLLMAGITLLVSESFYWTRVNELPLDMMLMQQRYRLDHTPLPELARIPTGSFNMGEQDQVLSAQLGENKKYWGVPGKQVQISEPFYLGKTEVTYIQFDYYVWEQQRAGNKEIKFPTTAKGGRGSRPVVSVNWLEAIDYATWLGTQIGQSCRLPTEAEWEYAARAGTQTAYPWGDDLGIDNANCASCGSQWDNEQAAPVGSFKANAYGLHDMSGNVWEWTSSNWRDQFNGNEQERNEDTTDTQQRVLRGGSWYNGPDDVRSSARIDGYPDELGLNIGFRLLCSSPIE